MNLHSSLLMTVSIKPKSCPTETQISFGICFFFLFFCILSRASKAMTILVYHFLWNKKKTAKKWSVYWKVVRSSYVRIQQHELHICRHFFFNMTICRAWRRWKSSTVRFKFVPLEATGIVELSNVAYINSNEKKFAPVTVCWLSKLVKVTNKYQNVV